MVNIKTFCTIFFGMLFLVFGNPFNAYAESRVFYESFDDPASITANGGAIIGSTYSFVPGLKGNAVNFTNSYAQYPLTHDFKQGTIEFWFKPGSDFFTADSGFFDVGVLSGPSSMGIFWVNNLKKIIFEIRDEASSYYQSWVSQTLGSPDNAWHKITITWQCKGQPGDFMRIFLDGIPGTYQTFGGSGCNFNPVAHAYKMASGYTGHYSYTRSIIDEMEVFDYIKSESDIASNPFEPRITSYAPSSRSRVLGPGEDINFSIDAIDPTGHGITIDWFVNGSGAGSGNSYDGYVSTAPTIDEIKAVISNGFFTKKIYWELWVRGAIDPGTVTIFDDSVYIGTEKFLIKGIDYTPWLIGTGPEQTSAPLPGENDDVTAKVTSGGITYVPDYSGDGVVQMWEVIRYDMETMKSAGANTVRTYATGYWHDRNLNGVEDAGETVQGDLPDWVIDRMLAFANANNMKIILGYWVQEEDKVVVNPEPTPYECNFDDLEVAKRSFGRIVQKYSNDPAVLCWGIGNEVGGSFNQGWFIWTVDIIEYLNRLYAYVRSIDPDHKPILYAKYIGEAVDFENLSADILGPQAYIFSAEQIASEFINMPPVKRAYMLGEYAHLIEHIDGHWNLAKGHAGGCFLEYVDVWWKGGDHANLGIVEEYRAVKHNRFDPLLNIYTQNNPPEFLFPDTGKIVKEGDTLEFTISATDPDMNDGELNLTASNLPYGAIFTNNYDGTATFRWTPNYTQSRAAPYVVTFTVSDGSLADSKNISITVSNVLVFGTIYKEVSGQKVGLEGATISVMDIMRTTTLASTVTDANGKFYLVSDSIPNGNYIIKTSKEAYNTYSGVTILRNTQALPFSVTLYPPVFGSMAGNLSVNENEALSLAITASDINRDRLSFSASNMPEGAILVDNNNNTANFAWTPNYNQQGNYDVDLKVTDGLLSSNAALNIEVRNVNSPPVIEPVPGSIIHEGQTLSFKIKAADADIGDIMTFSAANLPQGAALNSSTGEFKWIPGFNQAGTYDIIFKVNDNNGGEDSGSGTINVVNSSLYGRVFNKNTNLPVPNVKIIIYRWNKIMANAVTDNSGRYLIPRDLTGGVYLVRAIAQNRVHKLTVVWLRPGSSLKVDFYIK